MAATATTTITTTVTGLGNDQTMNLQFIAPAPSVAVYGFRTLGVINTPEALDVGNIDSGNIKGVWIKAVSGSVDVDPSFSGSFGARLTIPQGQAAYFVPSSGNTIKVSNTSTTPIYEYLVFG